MVRRLQLTGTRLQQAEFITAKCGTIAMDRSVYQARWLLAPVFVIGLSAAVLAVLSG
jgi:hypothetical protein